LKPGAPLLLKARVQIEEAGTRLSLQEARRLEDMADRSGPSEFRLRLEMSLLSDETLNQLEELFASTPGPTAIVFELVSPDGSMASLQSQKRIRVKPELEAAIRRICGQQAIQRVA